MVAFKLNQVLIPCISGVKFIGMVRLDEIVRVPSGKECWDEALIYVADWR